MLYLKRACESGLLPIRLAQQALDVVAGATVEDCDRGSAGFPAQSVGVPKPVYVRGRLSGLSHGMPLAGRLPLPWVWRRRQLSAGHPRPAAVSGVPAPDLGDGRHRLGPHAAALAALVRHRLLGHHPHAGLLGVAAAAPARAGSLRDGLDHAAEAASRDASTRARPTFGHGGVGRDLYRRGRGRAARRPAARDSKKSILAGAVEVRGHGSGRIRLAVVPDLSAATFAGFAEEAIAPGSTVLTDGWHSYRALRGTYAHRPTVIGDPKNAAKQLPRVHRAFANLKTWLLGTHHGVGAKHLPHYVDEFVFRFNRRRTPMAAFQSLLGLTTRHAPTTYQMLHAAEPTE